MTINKADKVSDFKISSIAKAATYFVDVLNPAYDNCYKIMSEHDKERENMSDDFSTVDSASLIVNRMSEMRMELEGARDDLTTKQDEFELLKVDFDGFDLKSMDRKIKEILK